MKNEPFGKPENATIDQTRTLRYNSRNLPIEEFARSNIISKDLKSFKEQIKTTIQTVNLKPRLNTSKLQLLLDL